MALAAGQALTVGMDLTVRVALWLLLSPRKPMARPV